MLDCEAIVQLMNNGFTFIDSCNLIENKQNNKVFNFIMTNLFFIVVILLIIMFVIYMFIKKKNMVKKIKWL